MNIKLKYLSNPNMIITCAIKTQENEFAVLYPEVEARKFHPILCSQKQVKLEPSKRNQAKFTLIRFNRCVKISVKVHQYAIVSQQVYDQCCLEIIVLRHFRTVLSHFYPFTSQLQATF